MKGIVPDDILEALKKKKLGLPGIDTDPLPEKNALVMGEFNVIKALIEKHPEAKFAKAQVCRIHLILDGTIHKDIQGDAGGLAAGLG